MPVAHIPLLKEAINEMVRNGVLRHAPEDTEWAAPTFCVRKKIREFV